MRQASPDLTHVRLGLELTALCAMHTEQALYHLSYIPALRLNLLRLLILSRRPLPLRRAPWIRGVTCAVQQPPVIEVVS